MKTKNEVVGKTVGFYISGEQYNNLLTRQEKSDHMTVSSYLDSNFRQKGVKEILAFPWGQYSVYITFDLQEITELKTDRMIEKFKIKFDKLTKPITK